MKVTILIFDGFTALDAIGPYEVLSRVPGAQVRFVARRAGEVRSDTGAVGLIADGAIDDVDETELLLVPGGPGTRELCHDEEILEWVRKIHSTTRWTTSVCTGSLVLGAAGVLKGIEATTHWAMLPKLADFEATPVAKRYVRQGKVVTAAGVSAGIDMALWLVGDECGDVVAQGVQLGIEYDPAPPYDCGSPQKAGPELSALFSRPTRG